MDVWVNPTPENAQRVYTAFTVFGAPLQDVTRQDFSRRDVVFQIAAAPRRIDIMTGISGVEFVDALRNASRVDAGAFAILVLSRADLIRNKEASGREKDLLDVKVLRRRSE